MATATGALHQYDYIFAISVLFAFLDAWNIGANDVANSFATSVSSQSLTMKQAVVVAAVMEFSGSVAVGSRVADTIRTRIIDPVLYENDPGVFLLAMTCALIGSATFLTIATRYGFPVSTTHSIIGGLVGAGTASVGISNINWTWRGASQVFVAWVLAPGIAGVTGAILFLITKFLVLRRKNAARIAFFSLPIYAFITLAAVTMLMVWKGIQLQTSLSLQEILISTFSVASGGTLLFCFFILPYLWRRVMHHDWQLKWYHGFLGPLVLYRPKPPPPPPGLKRLGFRNYYRNHLTLEELRTVRASDNLMKSAQTSESSADSTHGASSATEMVGHPGSPDTRRRTEQDDDVVGYIAPCPPGHWYDWRVLFWRTQRIAFRGVEKDVIGLQKRNALFCWNIDDLHARAERYDNRAEYMYSALQVLTASAASFIHGANDVANSAGPMTSTYHTWRYGVVEVEHKLDVPIWVLCFTGGSIVLGLSMYGYHVMRNLGNRLTLMSPSRGFCMELGSALTILLATRLTLPVSTTQCIAGASVGVGLANGDWRAVNLRLVAWVYLGWMVTVPAAGLISGTIMALMLNSPRWGAT